MSQQQDLIYRQFRSGATAHTQAHHIAWHMLHWEGGTLNLQLENVLEAAGESKRLPGTPRTGTQQTQECLRCLENSD